jgi:hypothetical protein
LSQKRQFFRRIFWRKYFKSHNIGPWLPWFQSSYAAMNPLAPKNWRSVFTNFFIFPPRVNVTILKIFSQEKNRRKIGYSESHSRHFRLLQFPIFQQQIITPNRFCPLHCEKKATHYSHLIWLDRCNRCLGKRGSAFSQIFLRSISICGRVARWFIFKPKIPIWVNFGDWKMLTHKYYG